MLNFVNNPACRLINPSKTEIGVISKHLLDDSNSKIVQATKVNLRRSTSNVIKWFNAIPEKCQYASIRIRETANEGPGLRIKIYKDHATRPAYYYPLEKITPLPPKLTMD